MTDRSILASDQERESVVGVLRDAFICKIQLMKLMSSDNKIPY
jgi:hypothetical protein